MAIIQDKIAIEGMHCSGCEQVIEQAVGGLPGVEKAVASYSRQMLEIRYDNVRLGRDQIEQAIVTNGYAIGVASKAGGWPKWQQGLLFLLLLAVVGGVAFWGKSQMPAVMRQIAPGMAYGLLLGIGLLTGFHCIGMCGGFVVGYTDHKLPKWRQMLAHLNYGLAKTASYTILGAGFGLLGSSIAITPQLRGGLALAASLFLVLYGLRMLNLFAVLRRFVFRLPASLNQELHRDLGKSRSAWITGLTSGLLLGCGPLQAMYVMAAGSGDPLQGGMMLMLFGLGTLPPLWGFGLFATLLSANAIRQLARVSGILVIVMGIMMAQRGMMLLNNSGTMPSSMSPTQSMH